MTKNLFNYLHSCPTDYIRIDDTTGTYITCGSEKSSYDNQLCSSVVYISYRAETPNVLFAKGFKIYYECNIRVN